MKLCTGCGLEYGSGTGKPHKTFCSACWTVLLAQMQLNVALAMRKWIVENNYGHLLGRR